MKDEVLFFEVYTVGPLINRAVYVASCKNILSLHSRIHCYCFNAILSRSVTKFQGFMVGLLLHSTFSGLSQY